MRKICSKNVNNQSLTYSLQYLNCVWLAARGESAFFAEDKLHSAIRKQAFIALVCIVFA